MPPPPQRWGKPQGGWAGPVRADGAFMALRGSPNNTLVASILLLLKALYTCKKECSYYVDFCYIRYNI